MRRGVILVVALLAVGGMVAIGWWYVHDNPEWWFWLQDMFGEAIAGLGLRSTDESAGLEASGSIEADEASVVTEMGGRVVALHADEGDEVTEGQVLVELDDSLLLARITMAEAELGVAEATLAQVKAGVRRETLRYAEVMLEQAKVAQKAAQVAWDDAQAMLDNPQELALAVAAARAQLRVLNFQGQQAEALASSAQAGRDFADEAVRLLEGFEPVETWVLLGQFELGNLPPEIPLPPDLLDGEYILGEYKIVILSGLITVYHLATIKVPADMISEARYQQALATYQSWTAWTGLSQVQAAKSGTESYLAELMRQEASPLVLQAQANAAEAQYEIATAAVGLAQAQVDGLRMGATAEQIAAVEAQVEIARAAVEALRVQAGKFTLKAPISGLVLQRPVQVGEVALPGAPLMTLADLDRVTLTVYVPQDQLGKVRIGQAVAVMADAYPGRTFTGTVAHVASQAEFTPKNVQTREERVNMVFAVKVQLSNADHALKPGMPADALLEDASRDG